jgi:hypothetical protein
VRRISGSGRRMAMFCATTMVSAGPHAARLAIRKCRGVTLRQGTDRPRSHQLGGKPNIDPQEHPLPHLEMRCLGSSNSSS